MHTFDCQNENTLHKTNRMKIKKDTDSLWNVIILLVGPEKIILLYRLKVKILKLGFKHNTYLLVTIHYIGRVPNHEVCP